MGTLKRLAPGREPQPQPDAENALDRSTRLLGEDHAYLVIDTTDLDKMLVEHTVRLDGAAMEYALSLSYRDEAELLLDRMWAQLDGEIRASNKDAKEAAIKALITLSPKIQTQQNLLARWKFLTRSWEGRVNSHKDRRYTLLETSRRETLLYRETNAVRSETTARTDDSAAGYRRQGS